MLPLLVSAILVVVLDQASKYLVRASLPYEHSVPIVKGLFFITHVQNKGAAFGLFSGKQVLFVIATVISVALIIAYYLRAHDGHLVFNIALGLELGGALGNLIDRLSQGYVTDFIHISYFPVFNVADIGIVAGVMLLMLAAIMGVLRSS